MGNPKKIAAIRESVIAAMNRYPADVRETQLNDVDRQTLHLEIVQDVTRPDSTVVDIGGGLSGLSLGLRAIGMKAVLVDDFSDPWHLGQGGAAILSLHEESGVEVVNRDVIKNGLGFEPESVDMFVSFDSMEHFHDSPKALFAEVMTALRPGGWFLMGVPNAVNLRKRVMVPLGRAKWSQMADWYESPVFRGHVREPDVGDLRYIANDMGLVGVRVFGRNWQGYGSGNKWVRGLTSLIDAPLQRRPSLCSDIYLLGHKPATSA